MIPRYSTGRTVRAVIIGLLANSACDDGAAYPTVGDIGSVSTFVLSARPFPSDDVARVDVHIAHVTLHSASIGRLDTIAMPARAFNLLDLTDGRTVAVARRPLPAFRYNLGVVMDRALSSITLKSGATPAVLWMNYARFPPDPFPAAGTTAPFFVPPEGSELVVDFNLARNVIPLLPGAPAFGFAVLPDVSVVVRATAGVIHGIVAGPNGPLAGAAVDVTTTSLWPDGNRGVVVVASDATDDAGRFRIANVPSGVYTVRAIGPLESTAAERTLDGVRIDPGVEMDVGTMQLPSMSPVAGTYVVRRVGRGRAERTLPTGVEPAPPNFPHTSRTLLADTIALDESGGGRQVRVESVKGPTDVSSKEVTRTTFAFTRRGRLLTLSYACPGIHCRADPVAVLAGEWLTVHVPPHIESFGWGWPRLYERVDP